ncbi:MAG: AraC family transcriptional regulator [Oscillospiraceae bacterium]|nr:AraC family transcriptional regulator [Oscillospiraceae bacterium]
MIYSAPYINFFRLAYRFEEDFLAEYLQIDSIGKEISTSHDYRFNGLTRPDKNLFVFQFTISGKGRIRIKDNYFDLLPGKAFLVDIPSDHEYFLDASDKRWEYIYISLRGEWAGFLMKKIMASIGNIVDIDENSRLIQLLENIFENVKKREVKDFFEASSLAYMFLMELYRLMSDAIPTNYPQLVKRALSIITDDYKKISNIDMLAVTLMVSKAHLIRIFSQYVGTSPGQYLIKTRLEHAIILLQSSNSSLDEIATSVGFSSGNYLGKVFRRCFGMSTGEYKRTQHIISVIK